MLVLRWLPMRFIHVSFESISQVYLRRGAAEAWRAHNPQVPGSKPGSEIVLSLSRATISHPHELLWCQFNMHEAFHKAIMQHRVVCIDTSSKMIVLTDTACPVVDKPQICITLQHMHVLYPQASNPHLHAEPHD